MNIARSETEMVWSRQQERPELCGKKGDGDEMSGSKKKRETAEEVDGLC